MSNSFNFGEKSSKKTLKSVLPFAGVGALILGVFGLLTIPSRIQNIQKCEELGLDWDASIILSGTCSTSFKEIIFVVGDTKNTPTPSVLIPDYIEAALEPNNSSVYAVSVSKPSRNPELIASSSEYTTKNKLRTAVDDYIKNMSAKNDGANYLEAIMTAAKAADKKDKTLIYVIGSGLSDSGLLNFADNNLFGKDVDPKDTAESIAFYVNDNTILKGITIAWDGIGQTVSPQPELESLDRNKIEIFYKEIFGNLGCRKVRFFNKLSSDSSVETDKEVKITFPEVIVYNETFEFYGDSDQFVNAEDAANEVKMLSSKMSTNPSEIVTITAYMSRGNCSRTSVNEALIAARLEAIKTLFLKNGISESRIKVVSGGFGDAPECEDGKYIEEIGKKNRKVEISFKS